LHDADFEIGSLRVTSYARPGKLFTANDDLIREELGSLEPEILQKLVDAIVELLKSG
jgi:mRNA interferase MazF